MKRFLSLLVLVLPVCSFAIEDITVPERHTRDLQKGNKSDTLTVRRINIMSNVGFDYADDPIVIMTGFSGKAYYSHQIDGEKSNERIYYNMGGGYASTEADLDEFIDLNNTNASAVIGISFERDLGAHFSRSWGFGLSQPIYDTDGNFTPEVSVKYGLKY